MDSLYGYNGYNFKIDLKFKSKTIQNSCNIYGIKDKKSLLASVFYVGV